MEVLIFMTSNNAANHSADPLYAYGFPYTIFYPTSKYYSSFLLKYTEFA